MKHQWHYVRKGKKIGTLICLRPKCELEWDRRLAGCTKPITGCPARIIEKPVTKTPWPLQQRAK